MKQGVIVQNLPCATYDPTTGIYYPGGSLLCFAALSCTTGQYLPFGTLTNATTNSNGNLVRIFTPRDVKLLNLGAVGNSAATVTVQDNGVDTLLQVTSAGGYVPVYDRSHIVSVNAGHFVGVKMTGTVSNDWMVTFEVV